MIKKMAAYGEGLFTARLYDQLYFGGLILLLKKQQ